MQNSMVYEIAEIRNIDVFIIPVHEDVIVVSECFMAKKTGIKKM